MSIEQQKITQEDFINKDIAGLPDRPTEAGMTAEALKNRFDSATKNIVMPKLNGLINILIATDGASNIGTSAIEGLSGLTVQDLLLSLKTLVDTKMDSEQADRVHDTKFDKAEAQALVKTIEFNEKTGVFTITKYDGSTSTIDTAIEKVALNVRLEGQQLVLTLVDGTEQRADLSAFIAQTETKNSPTINLTQESGVLVARVVPKSLEKEHFSDALTAYIEGKDKSAADSAAAAKVSEENAKLYAEQAKGYRDEAKNSQTASLASQQAAALSEANAKTSETNAERSMNDASTYRFQALSARDLAGDYRDEAYTFRNDARDAKEGAETAKAGAETARTGAETAKAGAEQSASNAATYMQNAQSYANQAKEQAELVDGDVIDAKIAAKADNLFFDTETNLLYLLSGGEIIGDGIQVATSTGGGGNGGSTSVVKLVNENGTANIVTAKGGNVVLKFNFTSTDDGVATGDGTCQISVDGVVRKTFAVAQGSKEVDVTDILSAGTNTVRVRCMDVYGTYKILAYTITVVDLSITSTFDDTMAYEGEVQFKYTPYGSIAKTIHFMLDGSELKTENITSSGKQFTEVLPDMAHGVHRLEVYATATLEEQPVESNHLVYDIICKDTGATDPMLASVYSVESLAQGELVSIPYILYDPNVLETKVMHTVYVIGEDGIESIYSEDELTVDRSRQYWNTRDYPMGTVYFEVSYTYVDAYSGETKELKVTHTLEVTESTIDVDAVTNDLELYLTSAGRSNGEDNPAQWAYGSFSTQFYDFNWINNGWLRDDNGDTVLRFTGDATAEISLMPFSSDLRVYGKTIELEFAIRDVNNRDAVVIDCMSGDIGFKATADRATLKSEQTTVFCNYRDEERIRLSFVIESRSEYRLMYVYLNGVLSGVKQYPAGDNFQQSTPMKIKIGSPYCSVDLYTVRSYSTALTFTEVTNNYIHDMTDMERKYELWDNNNIYDEYNSLSYDELSKRISVMTILGELPQSKGDKKNVAVTYKCLFDPTLSFANKACEIDVQGTSSQWYVRKNYKLEFQDKIQHHKDQIASNVFTVKADYAEATSTHNTQNANFVETLYSEKTPAQLVDERCRTTIYGYPIVIFHQATSADVPQFIGKYNFNFDKGSEEAFGFDLGKVAESWEFKNNTSGACNFLSNIPSNWSEDFEARYPDKNTNIANFKRMHDWVVSTKDDLDKFEAEFEDWFDLHYSLIYYVYTFVALMVDQRAKNMFMTYWEETGKWQPWFYDND